MRQSNLELYRIVLMLFIVAHHYVVLSGVMQCMHEQPTCINTVYLYIFGMWGKTAINCFLMITGYFMCLKQITFKKYLRLYLWIKLYQYILYFAFLGAGEFSIRKCITMMLPFSKIHTDYFSNSFMAWYLFIPFLNIVIQKADKALHAKLIGLLVLLFSLSTTTEYIQIESNPICWFSTVYIIASFIRKYPESIYKESSTLFWGGMTALFVALGIISVLLKIHAPLPFEIVSDSNKPLALLVSVSSFMYFKNINIGRHKIINILGAASYGVLLIHSGSTGMMEWLWKDAVDSVGHFNLQTPYLVLYSISVVFAIYIVCAVIDYARLKVIEEPLFKYIDKVK